MNQSRFDTVVQSLTHVPSRRDVLRGIAALGALALPGITEAKNKHESKKGKKKGKKQKPLKFNAYGCLGVGQPCRGDSKTCCSGICQGSAPRKGKPDTSTCVAHGMGSCKQEGEGICTATNPVALKCNNSVNCACIETTAGSNFCYEGRADQADKMCVQCSKDADCEALGFPPGSACAPVSTGSCAGICATGMACLIPCGAASTGP